MGLSLWEGQLKMQGVTHLLSKPWYIKMYEKCFAPLSYMTVKHKKAKNGK
jgi:hypothetical protein